MANVWDCYSPAVVVYFVDLVVDHWGYARVGRFGTLPGVQQSQGSVVAALCNLAIAAVAHWLRIAVETSIQHYSLAAVS